MRAWTLPLALTWLALPLGLAACDDSSAYGEGGGGDWGTGPSAGVPGWHHRAEAGVAAGDAHSDATHDASEDGQEDAADDGSSDGSASDDGSTADAEDGASTD